MNKKSIIALSIIIIFIVALAGFFLCEKLKAPAVSEENPAQSKQPNQLNQNQKKENPHSDLIQVSFPEAGEKVGGTINITGIARGTWYFEGDFPARLIDSTGKELAVVPTSAQGEWMTEEFIPFSATIRYPVSEPMEAKIVLEKDNPSDMRELDASIEIPVRLEPEITTTKIFFSSQHFDRNTSICEQVFPVARPAYETMALSRQTLEALLEGPTEKEKELGYSSAIPEKVKIQNFDISSRVAKIDLSQELLDLDVDVICRRVLIKKQIEETVKNSSDAEEVLITVDGEAF